MEEKQNSATIMISVDGKGTVFPVKLNYKGNHSSKYIKKKDLMNLIEANRQINMTSDPSVSRIISSKSLLNAKSFNMLLTLQQLYESR